MNSLVGTWQLIRTSSVTAEGTEMPAPYGGENSMGLVSLSDDGRMIAVLCDSSKELPAGKTREFVSYCGAYTFDGKQLNTQVDASSRPEWFGSEQVRDVAFEGDTLVLRPPLRAYAGPAEQRVLYWQKIS